MKNKEKILWCVAIIIIIILIVIMIFVFTRKNRAVETMNSNTSENLVNDINNVENEINEIQNNVQNDILIEENIIEPEIVTPTEPSPEDNDSEEISKEEIQQTKSNEEKAIEIAKKDWGEDSTVVFINDGVSKSTGKYIVAVRSASTRNAICYYHIDINTEEFDVKN